MDFLHATNHHLPDLTEQWSYNSNGKVKQHRISSSTIKSNVWELKKSESTQIHKIQRLLLTMKVLPNFLCSFKIIIKVPCGIFICKLKDDLKV